MFLCCRRRALHSLALVPLAAALLFALTPIHARAQAAPELRPGVGKDVVEATCTACHRTNMITRSSGYSRNHWRELLATMIDLSGSAETEAAILDYLVTHYPPNTKRQPKLVDGPAKVTFKEWVTPTLGQRARDPIQAADGRIWWAGQVGNLIGWLDPKTGAMKEYPLPENSNPHTVTLDAAGNVWYTGNKNATIGMLDIKTEKLMVYKMPDPKAKDPHSAIFDKHGILWFTAQHANVIGRLDPKTGDIKLKTVETPRARPYGIKLDASGTPWIACNGANCLIKVDPATMALTEIKLPGDKTTVRRLDIAAGGMIWYVNSGLGKLGRYDPKSGAIKE